MILIDNIHDLLEDIENYKSMFPDSYTSIQQIKKELEDKGDTPVGTVFGISVSEEWQDKCYGFETDRVTPSYTLFKYVGIWKT